MAAFQGVTPQDKQEPSSTVKAIAELKQICQEKWDVVSDSQAEINKISEPRIVNEDNPLAQILYEKQKRLKSEIEVVKNSVPSVLPDKPAILHHVLVSDVKKSISQLREVLTLARGQDKELREQIAQEEETSQQLMSVGSCLDMKLEHIENEDEEITMPLVMQELDDKISKAEVLYKGLIKKLVHFVNNHFPLPTVEDLKAGQKKLRSKQKKPSVENLIPFRVVLQELMNKCIDEPHDPYVTISDKYWPPYVELLLRCQIVLRHPEDDQRIKLVPFHL